MGVSNSSNSKAVGQQLAAVLPQDNKAWYQRGYLVKLNLLIISLAQLSSCNGYDGSIMNGLLALPSWNTFMDQPSGAWLGFINGVYWLGNLCVVPIAAPIANKYGRKPCIYIGYLFLIPGVILQSAANNSTAFVLARLLLGGASGAFSVGVPLLLTEIAYPTQRAVISSIYNTGCKSYLDVCNDAVSRRVTSGYVGAIIAAFVTYGTRNMDDSWGWRIPSILQILMPLVALPGLIIIPESPRFQMAAGRTSEARKTLTTYHAGDDTQAPLVAFECFEIENTLAAEKSSTASASYADMVRTPGNRWRLAITVSLAIFSQWSGNGVVSYYLALVLETVGITKVSDQLMISAGMQIWNLIFAVGAALLVDRLGRRFLFLASSAVMLISYVIITGLSASFAQNGNASVGVAVVPFLFIYFAGYDISLTPLVVAYPVEIWPYSLRSRGLTVTWVTVILAIFFNTFINPIALEAIGWKYYLVFVAVLLVMCGTTYFFYPETRGHSLEQMAVIFDGEEAALVSSPDEAKEGANSVGHAEVVGVQQEKGFARGMAVERV